MPFNSEVDTPTSASPAIAGRSPRQIAWNRLKRNKVGMAAAVVSILILLMSLFAPIVCRILGINPDVLNLEGLNRSGIPTGDLAGFSKEHPLGVIPGTGRDLLAQLLYGSRISFMIAIVTTITEQFGIAEGNGARVLFLILFLSFFGWPGFSRLIRSQVLSLREREFVTAAQAMGATRRRIIMKELVPNLWAPVIVVVSLSLPGYLAAEAAFSFLGLGVQPPASTWGILLSNATRFVTVMPSFFLISAASLVIVVLAFNLVGDALRDALDPRADK